VHQRTIRRDIQALCDAGFPLYDDKVNGTSMWKLRAKPFRALEETGLSVTELCALYFSRSLMAPIAGNHEPRRRLDPPAAVRQRRSIAAKLDPQLRRAGPRRDAGVAGARDRGGTRARDGQLHGRQAVRDAEDGRLRSLEREAVDPHIRAALTPRNGSPALIADSAKAHERSGRRFCAHMGRIGHLSERFRTARSSHPLRRC